VCSAASPATIQTVELTFVFEVAANASAKATFREGNMNYRRGEPGASVDVTELAETIVPVTDWALTAPHSVEGVGKEYAGTFSVAPEPALGVGMIPGAFHVCHVENLADDWR
jgi:hypothetical protein